MIERISPYQGIQLSVDEYFRDFEKNWELISGGFTKFERRQTFREPENASWVAFKEGNWEAAFALAENSRQDFSRSVIEAHQAGISIRRIRVISFPLSEYLKWELFLLMIRAQEGEDIRILDVSKVSEFERNGDPLPELVLLPPNAMYEVLYDVAGILIGARYFSDQVLIDACLKDCSELFEKSEAIEDFIAREIIFLPTPRMREK